VYHRANRISEVIDSYAKEVTVVHKKPIGKAYLTKGSATLTFKAVGCPDQSQGNETKIYRIYLKKAP
jgi:hypothetical protein